MGRKAKYTYEQKLKAVEEYISGQKSAVIIAYELSMGKHGKKRILEWANRYRENGPDILRETKTNNAYSREFKIQAVEEYLSGSNSMEDLAAKYGIRSPKQIWDWISKYNSLEELRDYDPRPEVYMAKRRKTTFEERKEIVEHCLDHHSDYKGTALKYGCSYSQVYQWVRNYKGNGTDGLKDKRGKRKKEEELSDLEKAQRRIKQLEHELLRKERENELLKKADEFERRWLKDFRKPDGSQ